LISAGALPQTLLRELIALPQTTSCDALLLRGREGRREGGKGRGGERKGWEREGMPSPASSILL